MEDGWGDTHFFIKKEDKMYKYFCGIDIAKNSFSVAIIDKNNRAVKTLTAKMNKEGFEKLLHTLTYMKNEVVVGMESSGSYHINLFHFLTKRGFNVIIINPLIVNNYNKLSLRKCKTDEKDATTIAKVILLEKDRIKNNYPLEIREIARERESFCYQIAKIKTEIKRLVHILFPEITPYVFSKSILNLLSFYPSAHSIANASPEKIKKLLKRKITLSPEKIISLAKNSIGIKNTAFEIVLKTQINTLFATKDTCDKITKSLINIAKNKFSEEIDILTSIKGIDTISAVHFLAEIGNIKNFSSYKKIIAYAGIDPIVYKSGEYEGKSKISKKGNKHLRRVLWIMGVSVSLHNPHFKTYFMKKRREGKPYKMAIMCVIHKLIRTIYSMLINKTHFISPEEDLCQNSS